MFQTFYRTFNYTNKQLAAFQDLLNLRDEASNTFYKSYFELELRKDKAFAAGDVFKHCKDMDSVKIPKEELLKNRVVTRTMMFREVARAHSGKPQGERDAALLRFPEQPSLQRRRLAARLGIQALPQGAHGVLQPEDRASLRGSLFCRRTSKTTSPSNCSSTSPSKTSSAARTSWLRKRLPAVPRKKTL
jgi:hypothetical protein